MIESDVIDKVWFTYKARVQAHIRLDWFDFHSQLLLIWYAIVSVAIAIISIKYEHALGKDTSIISSVVSVILLGITLAVTNMDFRGRSIEMRKNYLALQHLYDRTNLLNQFNNTDLDEYHKLLSEVENHKEIDDKIFRVNQYNSLKTRKPTCFDFLQVYLYLTIRLIIVSSMYLAPIIYFGYNQL